MKKPSRVTWLLCFITAGPAMAQDDLMRSAQSLFEPIPAQPPAVTGIERTPARVELGKMSYFEPRLSESHAISCN